MSTAYTAAIAELERARGALQGQLDRVDIALTSLRELDVPKKAEKVGRSVGRSVGRYKNRAAPREGRTETEGDSRTDFTRRRSI